MFFFRGASESQETVITKVWDDTLYDLLSAYAAHKKKVHKTVFRIEQRQVWSLQDAHKTLTRLIGDMAEWLPLETFLAPYLVSPKERATVLASSFSASLEMAREGSIDLQQGEAFAPIYIRRRKTIQSTGSKDGVPGLHGSAEEPANGGKKTWLTMSQTFARKIIANTCVCWRPYCFASAEPLGLTELAVRLPEGIDLEGLLFDLQSAYASRGVTLVRVAGKWAYRTADDLAYILQHEAIERRKLSRAAIETLSIIAYHQPTTRAEIEEIRGVSTSKGTIDVLLETGWIGLKGRRKTPGKPVTYGTSEAFLVHFGLENVSDLPGLEELKQTGLLDLNPQDSDKTRQGQLFDPFQLADGDADALDSAEDGQDDGETL